NRSSGAIVPERFSVHPVRLSRPDRSGPLRRDATATIPPPPDTVPSAQHDATSRLRGEPTRVPRDLNDSGFVLWSSRRHRATAHPSGSPVTQDISRQRFRMLGFHHWTSHWPVGTGLEDADRMDDDM